MGRIKPPRVRLAIAATAGLVLSGLSALSPTPAAAVPSGFSVTGLDVSAFQGTIDWAAVAGSGVRFAYIRASEQDGIADPTFAANYAGAKANGLYAGAYHRARPDLSSGTAQADNLIDQAQFTNDGRTLPPMLDIEWPRANWPGLDDCYNMTAAQLVTWIGDFVNEIAVRTGRMAMVYTNPNWWNPCTAKNAGFGAQPLFHSGYLPAPPPLPAGWSTFALWQYTSSGSLPGITGSVDLDVFNGDLAGLARLAAGTPTPPVASLLSRANSRFVSAENGGREPLLASRTKPGLWERFTLENAGGGYVALRAYANNRYVTAESAGAKPLIANRTAIGLWERFRIVSNADGTVSLRAAVNNRYVTAESGGAKPLIANRTAIGLWEKFDQVGVPVTMSFRAAVNARYASAESVGAKPLIANRIRIGAWEQFDVVGAGDGFVALLAHANGMYVTAENRGEQPLIANRTAIGAWEKFGLVSNADGTVSLRAAINSRYVTAGPQPLIANATSIGTAQKFFAVTA
jgi:GH25 family lysozyme M1 (1,4-beta-N-acetylmuramidase)